MENVFRFQIPQIISSANLAFTFKNVNESVNFTLLSSRLEKHLTGKFTVFKQVKFTILRIFALKKG